MNFPSIVNAKFQALFFMLSIILTKKLGTVKWGDIEQQGDIEQSYPFHGN